LGLIIRDILFFIPQFIFNFLLFLFRLYKQIAFFDEPVMEFIGCMQAFLLAYFPQVIIVRRVLCFLIHHLLYRTLDVITVLSSFIFYKSFDWHNHKDVSGYLKFSQGITNCVILGSIHKGRAARFITRCARLPGSPWATLILKEI